MLGKTRAERGSGIEEHAVAVGQVAPDRAGDDVARRKLAARHAGHEARPGFVDQRRALAAYRLADQRQRMTSGIERRRVELHKLQVNQSGPGASPPIARPWPNDPRGFVVWRNNPPMPPVASTTRLVGSSTGPVADAASTPLTVPSTTISRRASKPSSTVIEGVCRTAAASARMISLPVPSPVA